LFVFRNRRHPHVGRAGDNNDPGGFPQMHHRFPSRRLARGAATVLVAAAPMSALAQAAEPTRGPDTPTATPTEQALPSVQVVGRRQSGAYHDTHAAGATKTDTPLLEVPQAVRVVPRQLLDDLGALRVDDALDFVAGASRQNNFGGIWDNIALRGFAGHGDSGMALLRNGISANRGFNAPRDTANVERLEFLKGTMGALYGSSEPGGTINVVTKSPRFTAAHALEAYYGSHDTRRLALDSTGPIGGDATQPPALAYRLNVSVEDKDSFRDHVHSRRELVAPALAWKLGSDTTLRYDGEWLRQRAPLDRGVPAPGGQLGVVPATRFYGEPADGDITVDNQTHQFFLDHALGADWRLHAGAQFKRGTLDGLASEIIPGSCVAVGTDWECRRRLRLRGFESHDTTLQWEVAGKLLAGGVEHELLAGIETARFEAERRILSGNYASLISLSTPVHGAAQPALAATLWDNSLDDRSHALYLQDQVSLGRQWKMLAGVRHDRYRGRYDDRAFGFAAGSLLSTEQNVSATSPRLGLTWLPLPEFSVYASVGRSFRPQIITSATGQTFDPETGTANELGVKWQSRDGRLGATVSAYDIAKRHVVVYDSNGYPSGELAGKVRNKGLEAELAGWVAEGWRVALAYAYLDADPRITNFARHSGSVFVVHERTLAGGSLVGLGGGVTHVGERTVDLGAPMLPAYTTAKLTAYWRATPQLRLSLDVDNLTDRTYYASGYNNAWIGPGAPRTVTAGVQYKF
jgi:iron complex outermembrane receptor protein